MSAMPTFDLVTVGAHTSDLHDSVQIALANVPVSAADSEARYR